MLQNKMSAVIFFPAVSPIVFIMMQVDTALCTLSPVFDFNMNVQAINESSLDSSIINASFHADTLEECTYRCNRRVHLSIYYLADQGLCHCNSDLNRATIPLAGSDLIYGNFSFHVQNFGAGPLNPIVPLKFDCYDLYLAGVQTDGVYPINPTGLHFVAAQCDMTDGGWTKFQNRMNGKVIFERGWSDYRNGFGDVFEDYWLGLENMHILTQQRSMLKIELLPFSPLVPCYKEYSRFVITDESDNYRLIIDGISGTCSYGILTDPSPHLIHNNSIFSTFDADNDNSASNCAEGWESGWWFNACWVTNLNGYYNQANTSFASGYGLVAASNYGWDNSMKETVMKLRRL